MSLFNRFQHQYHAYISTHLSGNTDFLVGLSGGVDSVVLLHLFSRLKVKVRAIYIHHGLSINADHWAVFGEQYCKRLNIPFDLQKVTVDRTKGIENGARQARYQAVSQYIQPNEVFVTAHHLDDQAETFLLALKRGSGVKGLSAMQVVGHLQNVTIFRPLLTFTKAELLAYAKQHQLNWVEDESNMDSRYDRNFLRNEILPQFNHRWQQFSQMVAKSAQHCAEQQALIEELLCDELSQRMVTQQQLMIAGFSDFSLLKQQQLIRLWLEKNGVLMPTQAQLQAVISELIFAKPDKTPQVRVGGKLIRRYQKAIYLTDEMPEIASIEQQLEPQSTVALPHSLGEVIRHQQQIIFKKNEKINRLCLPQELTDETVIIKIGQSGKVKLYGKAHREEMKKIWQQNSVPVWERAFIPLIFWRDELVAVIKTAP